MELKLSAYSLLKGDEVKLFLTNNLIEEYNQVQVEIFNTGVDNPKSVLGFGTKPLKTNKKIFEVSFSTKSLNEGIYEIKLVRLHTKATNPESNDFIDFIGGKDFERLFFEIISSKNNSTNVEKLKEKVIKQELQNEQWFVSGIDISKDKDKKIFCVFVLIKGLKLGIRYKLEQFEIFPLNKGLDSIDELTITNYFLKNNTITNLFFEYQNKIAQSSQNKNPVSIAHFPRIICDSQDDARSFAEQKIKNLLSAFSLTRGANGDIFDFILINIENGKGTRITPSGSYKGNLVVGGLAGEDPDSLKNYIYSLERDPFKQFLVSLHKETINEDSIDFKFLRYWTILEILAESKNYNKNEDLLDHKGNIIHKQENGKIKIDKKSGEPIREKVFGSLNIVYNLLKEHGMDTTSEIFENVKMWYGLRNAVAHFGSISSWSKLGGKRNRVYAEKAIKIMEISKGHNQILFVLKEQIKLILMREINLK